MLQFILVVFEIVKSSQSVHPLLYTGWSERFLDNPLFKHVNQLVEAGKIGMKSGEGDITFWIRTMYILCLYDRVGQKIYKSEDSWSGYAQQWRDLLSCSVLTKTPIETN